MPSTAVNSQGIVSAASDQKHEQWLHVVAAVILDESGRVLLARRPANKHQGGKWEFPGGKVETSEAAPVALARELCEELGISAAPERMENFIEIRHRYAEKNIFLDVWLVRHFCNEPYGREGQVVCWFMKQDLAGLDFPAANTAVIDKLLA